MSLLQHNIDEDSDDAGTFQQQALEICLPDDNFDPCAVPTNGEEFLTYMAYERKNTPVVITRRPRAESLTQAVSEFLPTYMASVKNDEECAAHGREFVKNSYAQHCSEAWKEQQLQLFQKARDEAHAERDRGYQHSEYKFSPSLKYCSEHVPLLNRILCHGQRELSQFLEAICEWLQKGEEAALAASNVKEGETTSESELLAANQATADINLKVTTLWLGQWLYATLVCLNLPLEPEVHSNMREIARIFVRQRGRLSWNDENLTHINIYNIFIHLIAKFFGQMDFAEFL